VPLQNTPPCSVAAEAVKLAEVKLAMQYLTVQSCQSCREQAKTYKYKQIKFTYLIQILVFYAPMFLQDLNCYLF
jgi:hypothetical protein